LIHTLYLLYQQSTRKNGILNEILDDFEILQLKTRVCVDLKRVSIKRQRIFERSNKQYRKAIARLEKHH
jgi:hypothetical protein